MTCVGGKSRKRERRGGGQGNNRMPPAFDQQASMEAIGTVTATIAQASVVATTIAQASTTVGQRGSSNLQRFIAHHPPTFIRRGDPRVANHWFRQIEKILEAIEITIDASRIKLAAF